MTLRIKEVAKQKGIYMKDIATTLGISDGGLSQQLNGNPTIETLQKIADALGVHISELFTNYRLCKSERQSTRDKLS